MTPLPSATGFRLPSLGDSHFVGFGIPIRSREGGVLDATVINSDVEDYSLGGRRGAHADIHWAGLLLTISRPSPCRPRSELCCMLAWIARGVGTKFGGGSGVLSGGLGRARAVAARPGIRLFGLAMASLWCRRGLAISSLKTPPKLPPSEDHL